MLHVLYQLSFTEISVFGELMIFIPLLGSDKGMELVDMRVFPGLTHHMEVQE